MALFRRSPSLADGDTGGAEPAAPTGVDIERGAEADPALPPSRMRGTEPLYGYVVGLELLVVAILNIVITTGKGAPAHPQRGLQIVGILAPIAFFGVLQTRNRTIVGFAAIVAAFFVTLPKVPSALSVAHVFALAIPLAYGLIITQRQRRAMGNATRGARRRGGAAGQDAKAATTTARRSERRRGRKAAAESPAGPRPSARYTPPKTKRGQARR